MNKATKLAFLVGASQAAYADCTAYDKSTMFPCGDLFSDAACTVSVAQTAAQPTYSSDVWWNTVAIGCVQTGAATSAKAQCDSAANLYKPQTFTDAVCGSAATDGTVVTGGTSCTTYSTYTPASGSPVVTYIKFQNTATGCSGAVGTGDACSASWFNCGQSFPNTACTAATQNTLTQAASEAIVPTLVTECTPDPANLSQTDPTKLKWWKGNCKAAVASPATAATYTKIAYGDSGCMYTTYPYTESAAGDTIVDGTCYTGTAYAGASATTAVKYHLLAATCAYVAPATLMDCPVTNDFFKCSNKFSDTTCTAANSMTQTGAEANYTAQKVNDAMLTTCTATTVNSVTTYTKGQCDPNYGYFVNTFLDANCLYNSTATALTGLVENGVSCAEILPALATKEYAKYYTDGGSAGGCTFTEAQQYGAKPFMMAASAALVAAASMF